VVLAVVSGRAGECGCEFGNIVSRTQLKPRCGDFGQLRILDSFPGRRDAIVVEEVGTSQHSYSVWVRVLDTRAARLHLTVVIYLCFVAGPLSKPLKETDHLASRLFIGKKQQFSDQTTGY
jgi:hypothetical protein